MMWSDYIDESYNSRTFCVGGSLAPVQMWSRIESRWKQRIDYENRISAKKGFPVISRYHATYCANLKQEFAEAKGWTIPRQIRFSKRLCQILADNGPCAIVYGGSLTDAQKYLPPNQNPAKEFLYHVSTFMHLMLVGEIMRDQYPGDRVTVYYDRSKQFGSIAHEVFDSFMNDASATDLSRCFAKMIPMGWEDCIALQPADLIAYEGMKRVDGSLVGNDRIRKSLRALLGNTMPLRIEHFTEQNFIDFMKIIENKSKGNALNEGVSSKLRICHNR